MSYTIVSTKRPLPVDAGKKLEKFEILNIVRPNKPNKFTIVETEKKPPKSLLDRYELKMKGEEPEEVWKGSGGETILIYENKVVSEGEEMDMTPKEAKRLARESPNFKKIEKPITEELGLF